jgi:hypothetical protein
MNADQNGVDDLFQKIVRSLRFIGVHPRNQRSSASSRSTIEWRLG